MPPFRKISAATVRADFNDPVAVVHYTRAAHFLGLWKSEQILIDRFFPDTSAALIEAGCGSGRVTLGLWTAGYTNITAFDFAEELLGQARDLASQRGADAIRFHHADATRLHEKCHVLRDTHLPPHPSASASEASPPPGSCNVLRDTLPLAPRTDRSNQAHRPPGVCNVLRDNFSEKSTSTPATQLRPSSDGCNVLSDSPRLASETDSPTGATRLPEVCNVLSDKPTERSPSDVTANARRPPDVCNVLRDKLAVPANGFSGALFMFNGLMQIPGRENRRAALRELHAVCRPGSPLLFTSHDRNSTPTERALWRLEKQRWDAGTQDARLVEFGDRYFEDEHGRTFMHLPDRAEILDDLAATKWTHVFDAMRREIARESPAVQDFSDECRFWAALRQP